MKNEIDKFSATWQTLEEYYGKRLEALTEDLINKQFEDLSQVQDVQSRIREIRDLLGLAQQKQSRASL